MELVVAEKPSVARDLARVLGVRPSGNDAFEGRDHVITWCIGHLVELDEPGAYAEAWKAWRLDALPMLPDAFLLRASKHAEGHLRAVKALLRDRRFTGVINACDAGREGELIFRYVYQFAKARLPVRRLWISSMTDEAIQKGLATLRAGALLDPLADAARSRSEADWLVGMNATRAVTVRNREGGHTSLYSIGRVQTPTLAMLVAREQQIRAFVPRDYWEIRAELTTAEGRRFGATWRHVVDAKRELTRFANAVAADEIVARDRAQAAASAPTGPRVERIRAKTVREPPPLLFDLTSLQRTANRRFGFTATRTLELAQALYERHKLLTYPRTDARHLSNDLAGELPALFGALAGVAEYAAFAQPLVATPPPRSRRVFDDAKVHDHHAIIPTGTTSRLDGLDRDERRLFDLVVRRFLGAFHPDAEFAVTEVWIRIGAPGDAGTVAIDREDPTLLTAAPPPPDRYFTRGRIRTVAGWQLVAGIDEAASVRNLRDDRAPPPRPGEPRDVDAAEDPVPLLPPLVEGQALDGAFASQQKQTRPPPRYTEATLLGAMESAGKAIDDEALRAAMKDSGLGTQATRAAIIETLLKRAYIVREHQHLVPTETGTGLIEALPVASLGSPELTGQWEARLARIARGEDSRAAFMADIRRYVAGLVTAVRGSTPAPPPANQPPPAWERSAPRAKGNSAKRGRGTSPSRAGSPAPSRTSSPAPSRASSPRSAVPVRTSPPAASRIGVHHDAGLIAALRAGAPRED
ncbi:MAG: DNA topoisomerase, partial [Kofleriaceae bacterium]